MEGGPREDLGGQDPEQRQAGVSEEEGSVADLGFVGDSKPIRQTFVPINAKVVSRQEWTRAILAFSLTGLLAVILLIALLRADSWADIKQLLDLAVPAVTGLLGSAIGFYFGTKG
jgi:hypothetical protein